MFNSTLNPTSLPTENVRKYYSIIQSIQIANKCTSMKGRRDHMVVGFTTTYAISAYHYKVCRSNPTHGEVYSLQHYMIKFVSDLWQVSGFLWILHTRFSSTNKTDCHNITETLLKVALNTIP
jgi:hydrogenase maturation factor